MLKSVIRVLVVLECDVLVRHLVLSYLEYLVIVKINKIYEN